MQYRFHIPSHQDGRFDKYVKCKTPEQLDEVLAVLAPFGEWQNYTSLSLFSKNCALNYDELSEELFEHHHFSRQDVVIFHPLKQHTYKD